MTRKWYVTRPPGTFLKEMLGESLLYQSDQMCAGYVYTIYFQTSQCKTSQQNRVASILYPGPFPFVLALEKRKENGLGTRVASIRTAITI